MAILFSLKNNIPDESKTVNSNFKRAFRSPNKDSENKSCRRRLEGNQQQADWKPESPDKFGDISEFLKAVDSLKIEDTTKQGLGSKASKSAAAAARPTVQKPVAYRPPHAKAAAAVQAELLGGPPPGEMSKNALKNKKKREKQREKKAAEASEGAA